MADRRQYIRKSHAYINAINSARAFVDVSPSYALFVSEGRVVSKGHAVALRIASAQLRARVKRGRGFALKQAQIAKVEAFLGTF